MKPFSFFTVLLAITISCQAQTIRSEEFNVEDNGLIYSQADMKILRKVVDSLSLRFKTCDLTTSYYSHPQATVRHLQFRSDSADFKKIRQAIETGIEYEALIRRFGTQIYKSITGSLIRMSDPYEQEFYLWGTPTDGYDVQYDFPQSSFGNNKWVVYESATGGRLKFLHVWYLASPFASSKLPDEYAKLLQYVDCMIDTNTARSRENTNWSRSAKSKALEPLVNFLNAKMHIKKKDEWKDYFTEEKFEYAINNLLKDTQFVALVRAVVDSSIKAGEGNEYLEDLAGILLSKDKKLEIMRNRVVMGRCSRDPSPRLHALRIAKTSAEAHRWDIFLRAHLDIMNDRFERTSDGSYAYGGRGTYLKELEELNLNVIDLMLGMSLRSPSVSDNHYNGTVWRLGRALAESKDRLAFESRVITMMNDHRLDAFNRGLLCLLYRNYLGHLPDEKEKIQKEEKLNTSFAELFNK